MNVYVREMSAALARAGLECDVFTRAESALDPRTVAVEPGFRVHYVPAGPAAPVPKEQLPQLVDEFAAGVLDRLTGGIEVDAIHANYWLSGLAGHALKHELDRPLVCTFHTLDRVKAEGGDDEQGVRALAEADIIGCSDAVLASCSVEAKQLIDLYGADPGRIEIVAPGVDHAFFAPGQRGQARRALALPEAGPVVLFVGRIQPLKGLDVAVRAFAQLDAPGAVLVVVGGPSGPDGEAEQERIRELVDALGIAGRVRMVPPHRHELLSTFYRAADVCVVPSRSESFGLVALEAAACGTPVVAAAVGGLTTLVEDGTTGYLVETRDPGEFAAHMQAILDDPARAALMGGAAAERARGYTWSVAAGRMRRLYSDLTSRQLVECR